MSRFAVVAGPHAGVEHVHADARLREVLAESGATHLSVLTSVPPIYGFMLRANTVADALATVTTAFRSVYGSAWWGDVAQIETGNSQELDQARRPQSN